MSCAAQMEDWLFRLSAVPVRNWQSAANAAHYLAGKALKDPKPGCRTRMEARKSMRLPSMSNLQYLGDWLADTVATLSAPGLSVTPTDCRTVPSPLST